MIPQTHRDPTIVFTATSSLFGRTSLDLPSDTDPPYIQNFPDSMYIFADSELLSPPDLLDLLADMGCHLRMREKYICDTDPTWDSYTPTPHQSLKSPIAIEISTESFPSSVNQNPIFLAIDNDGPPTAVTVDSYNPSLCQCHDPECPNLDGICHGCDDSRSTQSDQTDEHQLTGTSWKEEDYVDDPAANEGERPTSSVPMILLTMDESQDDDQLHD